MITYRRHGIIHSFVGRGAFDHVQDNPGRANWSKIEVSKVFSQDRVYSPRYIQQDQRQGDLHFHFKKRDFRVQSGITPALTRVEPRGKHLEFPRRDATSHAIKHSSIAQLLLPRTWSERGIANLLESEISESFACCEIKSSLIGILASFVVYH